MTCFINLSMCVYLILLLSDLIVKCFRFYLGSKIVIDGNSLTVGRCSWDVLSLTKCVAVAQKEANEYTIYDKSGKKVANFADCYTNADILIRWLKESGCEKIDKRPGIFFHLLSILHICE